MKYASSHLLSRGRSEDGTRYSAGKQAGPDERGEAGFMAGAAARDERDLRGGRRGEVDDLVGDVALYGGVGVWDGEEGGVHEVGRVVDEVFCCIIVLGIGLSFWKCEVWTWWLAGTAKRTRHIELTIAPCAQLFLMLNWYSQRKSKRDKTRHDTMRREDEKVTEGEGIHHPTSFLHTTHHATAVPRPHGTASAHGAQ